VTIVLGIEGTAWNLSVAIVDEKDVIADAVHTYSPPTGGIHPREAAQHHASYVGEVISDVFRLFEEKGYSRNDIDAVAFSKGPGLGPCLRVVGTAARMVSLMLNKPLVGVNHCIAHIEVGLWKTEAEDPITLYVSGANSQVLAYQETSPGVGAYRIFGETLDIGLGNSLDKFARSAGLPHPGGPLVEKYAKESTEYIDLPYTVKGMDFFFSGLSTAATRFLNESKKEGNSIPDDVLANICFSYQETAFATSVEVTERALAHTGKTEVLLAGGVGANSRLREMLDVMCKERGAQFYVPEKKFMGDNGAMIAYTGLLMFKAGDTLTVENSFIDAGFRPDQVLVTWKPPKTISKEEEIQKMRNGAEAVVHIEPKAYGFEKGKGERATNNEFMIVKERIQKGYRISQIDSKIRKERTRTEVRMMTEARKGGILVPIVYGVDDSSIKMEKIDGVPLKFAIEENEALAEVVGEIVGKMHALNIIHGDLTTSNMIYSTAGQIYLIDFGLSFSDKTVESKGVDVHVLLQTFESSHHNLNLKGFFEKGYSKTYSDAEAVLKRAEEIKLRGRYI